MSKPLACGGFAARGETSPPMGLSRRFIDPLAEIGGDLLRVEKPVRYIGGEYGRLARADDFRASETLKTAIAFPDLYEIGMSNQALRIIYNRLNRMGGISCDRVFAPAPDFESLLGEKNIPLYGLDTGIPLSGLDILMFTLGYELGITGIFTILKTAFIPLRRKERVPGEPIVIMGGPCVSNPLPYAAFIDAFWIGEAEGGFFDLMEETASMKRKGAGKEALLERLVSHPSVWAPGKARAVRAVDLDFARREASPAVFPISSVKTVQHHGAVEIMRGCPNGCRFCHAGFWYRPMRQKSAEVVREEAAAFINDGGYNEISLSSLSSGDYSYLEALVEDLNREFSPRHISFQLPSLRVSTFSLPLLEKISAVRKSGLTFAVETPEDLWQLSINKEVSLKNVVSILREAKRQGWRGAKFYFMIGLPVNPGSFGESGEGSGSGSEEKSIVDFIRSAAGETKTHFNINVGTFVPKPHTPYQWAAELGEEEARKKLLRVREELKKQGHKVSFQDPFISTLEGIISRGDGRAGDLAEEAWKQGCRLDAWTEYLKKDIWTRLIADNPGILSQALSAKDPEAPLPWDFIDSRCSPAYLKRENRRSVTREFTSPCIEKCTDPCGACAGNRGITRNTASQSAQESREEAPGERNPAPATRRLLFSFSKQGKGIFYSHLTLMEIFSMAFSRSSLPVLFSGGFNPLPRLEIAAPLSLGIASSGEIAALETQSYVDCETFLQKLNPLLPEGLRLNRAINIYILGGQKKHSLSSLLWGFVYAAGESEDHVPWKEEKDYRLGKTGDSPYGLERRLVLAKHPQREDDPAPYFEVFKNLYPLTDPSRSDSTH